MGHIHHRKKAHHTRHLPMGHIHLHNQEPIRLRKVYTHHHNREPIHLRKVYTHHHNREPIHLLEWAIHKVHILRLMRMA